jgi:hypothetical protein
MCCDLLLIFSDKYVLLICKSYLLSMLSFYVLLFLIYSLCPKNAIIFGLAKFKFLGVCFIV